MTQPSQVIAVAVVRQGSRFLIGQRPAGANLPGMWEFPGGKLHPGETPADACLRECLEETGLTVEIVAPWPPRRQPYDYALLELHFFECRVLAGQPRSPFRWIEAKDLPRYEFPAANAELVAELVRRWGEPNGD